MWVRVCVCSIFCVCTYVWMCDCGCVMSLCMSVHRCMLECEWESLGLSSTFHLVWVRVSVVCRLIGLWNRRNAKATAIGIHVWLCGLQIWTWDFSLAWQGFCLLSQVLRPPLFLTVPGSLSCFGLPALAVVQGSHSWAAVALKAARCAISVS